MQRHIETAADLAGPNGRSMVPDNIAEHVGRINARFGSMRNCERCRVNPAAVVRTAGVGSAPIALCRSCAARRDVYARADVTRAGALRREANRIMLELAIAEIEI